MITFVYDCPYCKAKHTGFEINGYKKFDSGSGPKFSIMANCNRCTRAIVGNTRSLIYDTASKFEEAITNQNKWSDLEQFYWTVGTIKFFPQPEKPDIPEFLPNDVSAELETAEQLFLLNGEAQNFVKPAGNSYRSVLEKALCHLADNPNRARLDKRIEHLFELGILTLSLKNFALRIRTLSADASHTYTEFTQSDLVELRTFVQLFLKYTFTLPAMIPDESKEEVDNK